MPSPRQSAWHAVQPCGIPYHARIPLDAGVLHALAEARRCARPPGRGDDSQITDQGLSRFDQRKHDRREAADNVRLDAADRRQRGFETLGVVDEHAKRHLVSEEAREVGQRASVRDSDHSARLKQAASQNTHDATVYVTF